MGEHVRTNPCVGARIPPEDVSRTEELVRKGRYLNISDFIRRAVREKLDREETAS
jgi:Arc/MetJ-type ribon-helix-helix transcriptional regulator